MTFNLYTGAQDLHNENKKDIATSILRPLFVYLCSKTEADLSSNLEIKCCVCSLDHTVEYVKKKMRLEKRPYPEDDQVGFPAGSKVPGIPLAKKKFEWGRLIIPSGFSSDKTLFEGKCLPIALCMGKMLYEAAFQGEGSMKTLLKQFRWLTGQIKKRRMRKELR